MITKLLSRSVRTVINIPIRNAIFSKSDQKITLTDNGSMFVCWHPKTDIPYEYTKPIKIEAPQETDSVLKLSWNSDLKRIFKDKKPDVVIQELSNITHTTKHRWYPRSRDRRAKETPMDRPYL